MKNVVQQVIISNPDKVLFPGQGITKQQLAAYYRQVSAFILPFLKNRSVMLHRFPQGIGHDGFYQKAVGPGFPEWLETVSVAREKQGPIKQVVVNSKAALLYLINLNTIVLHPWLSKVKDLHKPDKMIFDLAPAENGFKTAVKGALLLRELLEKTYKLRSFVMTSVSSGLHVTVPIKPARPFEEVRRFALNIAGTLVAAYPETFTTEQRIENRRGRLFVDYLRNAYAQTAVAPYSVRALPGAPVAAPLFWEELQHENLHAQMYNVGTMPARLQNSGNPWQHFRKYARALSQNILVQAETALKENGNIKTQKSQKD